MSSFKSKQNIKENINKTCEHCSGKYSYYKIKCPYCNLWELGTYTKNIPINESNLINIKNIYIINLQRDRYRLNLFFTNLKKNKISIKNRNWNRFNAIDGSDNKNMLSEIELLIQNTNSKEKFISLWKKYPGSMGCYLSHLKLWQTILDDEKTEEYSLIMEDDSYFTRFGLINIEIALQSAININWDILYAGHSKLKGKKISSLFLRPDTTNNNGHNYGFFGYIVRKSSLKKLIENVKNFDSHNIDVQIRNSFDKISGLFFISNQIRHIHSIKSTRKVINNYKVS
jgi:GR25 family glycosyltransferase involved in LPS biosynthesis